MYGFVVSNPVAKKVQTLHAVSYICSYSTSVTSARMLWESSSYRRHPHRRVIGDIAEIPPEAKIQFREHISVRFLALSSVGSSLTRSLNIIACPSAVSTLE